MIAGIPRSSKQRRFQPDGITVETYKHRERSTWRWRFITDLGEKDSGMVGTARPSSALDVTGDSERADMGLRLIQACGARSAPSQILIGLTSSLVLFHGYRRNRLPVTRR